jgi:hypothetical protein
MIDISGDVFKAARTPQRETGCVRGSKAAGELALAQA